MAKLSVNLSLVLLLLAGTTAARPSYAEEPVVTLDEEWLRPTSRRGYRYEKAMLRWPGQGPAEPGRSETIVTDRPHISEASSLVGLGTAQLESGYSYFHDRNAGVTSEGHSFGEALIRLGIFAEWFELRLADSYLMERTRDPINGNTRIRGFDDLYLGAKLGLTQQHGVLPEMAIFPQMRLPVGHESFSNDQVLPGYLFAYSWAINDWLELECNNQANRRIDDSNHTYVELIQTANFEVTFTDRFGGFYEFVMFTPTGALTAVTEYYFHTGFVYLITDNVQADIHSAVGLNEASADWAYTGVGLSIRR
ncbi:MAG: transporter [Pirellulales bacterium]